MYLLHKKIFSEAGASSTLFPSNIELVLKEILHANHSFQSGKALFIPNRPIQQSWRITYVCLKKTTYVRSSSIYHIVSHENWVNFWQKSFLQMVVFKVQKGSFCSKYAYLAMLKKHMSFERKSSLLEARASSTLFLYENWIRVCKEYFMEISFQGG
jgi:hypothetical protein